MKKNFFLGGKMRILIAAVALALMCCVTSTSCQKKQEVKGNIATRNQGESHTDTIWGSNGVWVVTQRLDWTWTHVHAENSDGEVMDFNVPTPCYYRTFPHDTTQGTPQVTHVSFTLSASDSTKYDTLGGICELVQYREIYLDTYNQYQGNDTLVHTEGTATCFGLTFSLPPSNASVTWKSVSTAEDGTDGDWDYTKATTSYEVKVNGGTTTVQAYHTLKREAGHDVFVRKVLINSGWNPTHFNAWGLPDQGTAWGDIADEYSESGIGTPTHYETSTICPISVPADSSLIAQNFNVSWKAAQLSSPVTVNTTTDGYFQITNKKKSYSVGATTPSFTRVFGLQYPKVVWTDGTYTFTIDVPEWSNFSESHTLSDVSPVTGYERKLATNYMSVSLGSYSGQIPAKTYIKVTADDPTPPDTTPTPPPVVIVYYEEVYRDLIYVDPNTNTSLVRVRPVYSDSTRGQEFDISINLINTMSTPAEGPVIVSDFGVVATNGGTPGETTQNGSPQINGDFRVFTYTQPYSADINVGQNLTWTGTWQKAIHIPTGIEMPYANYSYAVSAGSFTQDLGSETTQNITYLMKLWTQWITGTLNNHTHQYSGTCIVKAPDYIPRESPTEFGAVVDMVFSMVEPAHEATFTGCKFVEFQYGYGIFVQGNSYYYAKPGCTNNSIPKVPIKPYNSAIKIGNNWYPAKISMTAGGGSWSYIFADDYHITGQNQTNFTFTVMLGDAIANNVGGDDLNNPIPSCQTWSLVGPVGVLEYPHNNQVPYNNATFMTW